MKLLKTASSILFGVVLTMGLTACTSNNSSTSEENTQVEEAKAEMKYDIVMDEKFKKTEQREIRVTTDATDEKDFETITEEVMEKYNGEGLDSMHLYIHEPDGDSFGGLKAHSFIAFTQKGVAQTGIEKANSYKIEVQ